MVCSVLGCALFIPGGVLFIPRGCLIHPHPALIIPRVGLNWSPGMNRSLYLIWHVYLLPIWQAFFANGATMLCKRHEAAPARLCFCGAWPTKTEPSGRRWRRCSRVFMVFSFSAFEWSFCLCAPCPPRSHLSTRATPPRAISPRLFKSPPQGAGFCGGRGVRGP